VILAVPPGPLGQILPPDWAEEHAFLASIRHPPAVIVTLWLDRPLEAGVWSYFFPPGDVLPKGNGLVSFCTDAAQKNPEMVPSGRAALQAWICSPAADRAMAMEDAPLVDAVVRELARHFPRIAERIDSVHVQRHAHAVPQTAPGHGAAAAAFLAQMDRRPRLRICGDFLSGGYMECTLWSVQRALSSI
jgi:protoporphyrinogen oxidase